MSSSQHVCYLWTIQPIHTIFLEEFDSMMRLREATHNTAPYSPSFDISTLFDNTWYIDTIDDKRRRFYKKKTAAPCHNGINGFAQLN